MNRPPTALLAATDLSPPARLAADRAARLAHAAGARLRLVHVLDGSALAQLQALLDEGRTIASTVVEPAQRALDTLAAELTAAHAVPIDTTLTRGAVPDEIARQAHAMDADLLVVGARGAGGIRRKVLGSTAERLLRTSTVPVLAVKQPAHQAYQRVLVPVDFSNWSAPLVALARRVAPQAHLVLQHVWDLPFEGKLRYASVPEDDIERYRQTTQQTALLQLQALAAETGLAQGDWTPCLQAGDPAMVILEQERTLQADLIVIGKQGQRAAQFLLLGSVTHHVLAESAGDVLVSTTGPL